MRLIGTLPDAAQARRFVAYLHTLGVEAEDEAAPAGRQIWIHDEDAIERARGELEAFRLDPAAGKYATSEKQARELVRQEQADRAKRRDRVVTGRDVWSAVGGAPARRTTVTWSLIGASIVCTLLIGAGDPQPGNWAWEQGQFSSETAAAKYEWQALQNGEAVERLPMSLIFGRILSGEIWRLVTPIFFHFGMLHLVFNMLWLYQLGGQIEDRVRAWRYVLLVLLFALAGNLAQAVAPLSLGGGVAFGGMSGVVYGCFGYVWLKTLLEPDAGYRLSTFAVIVMVGWHVITSMPGKEEIFGVAVANVAAWAHGGGLVAGGLAAGAGYLLNRAKA